MGRTPERMPSRLSFIHERLQQALELGRISNIDLHCLLGSLRAMQKV